MNVPFVDATKITHDIETGMGIEGSRFGAGEDIVVEDEAEEQIDPRWNELKKILDNN